MTAFDAVLTLALGLEAPERERLAMELLASLSPAPADSTGATERVMPLLAAMQAGLAELAALDEFDDAWEGIDDL